jgi:hypothetical protein
VTVPRHRLAQAVLNLGQNAGEAMAGRERGLVRISAGVAAAPGGAPLVLLRVSDDGPGMPPQVLARCFEPYFSTKVRSISTGMGLGMVKGIVESAGGTVSVESAPGRGTTFTLALPAAAPAEPAAGGAAAERTAAVSVKQERVASLACLFLEQLRLNPVRHDGDGVPDADLWVLERPGASQVRAYLAQRPLSWIVALGAVGEEGGAGGDGLAPDGVRVTILPAFPPPGVLRDALAAARREVARSRREE